MDDSCAVCAETLEWVAYGPCAHREVCSTCFVRLRFICNDRSCCICKSECNFIFVTKALGDYTRMINDFSSLPANPIEGQVGQYWFHEGAQAYFDDFDRYKMIKAMCRLSCTVCDKKNEQRNGGSKRTGDFNNIEQLKSHLFHQHRLFMCSLCLEGRKVFISEQKLYNSAQLNQHVKTGDSAVDGCESERGGFMGHPICEFCRKPFYGDNELYLHMSTEHFTCHICQRQHPGQHEYYNDYNDLESHFRQGHFLCEDEDCLAKKFIVFAAESEMKRHNVMEHGGRMSRSKRNVALQIPTSFQYQRSAEQAQLRRGRHNHRNSPNSQLSMALLDSLERSNAVGFHENSFNALAERNHGRTGDIESVAKPLAAMDSDPASSSQASSTTPLSNLLQESSFPPLPMAPSSSIQRLRNVNGHTMAARLRNQNIVKVLNASRAASCHSMSSASLSKQSSPALKSGHSSSSNSACSSQSKPTTKEYLQSSHVSSIQSGLSAANDLVLFSNSASSSRTKNNVTHSSSATNLAEMEAPNNSISSSQVDKVHDVRSANKIMVEKVRSALDFDDDKFAAFKILSSEYQKDLIDMGEYLAYVHQFGLVHLILELAMLCPNPQKQRELVEVHKYNTRRNGSNENGSSTEGGNAQSKSKKSSKKGKEILEDNNVSCSHENSLPKSLDNKMMNLQLNHKPRLEESKDVCRSAKGKSKILLDEEANLNSLMDLKSENDIQSTSGCLKKSLGPGGGGNKPRKKQSKFLKNRLGDTLAASFLDEDNDNSDEKEEQTGWKNITMETLPMRGVWQNGGGQRLVVMTQRYRKK